MADTTAEARREVSDARQAAEHQLDELAASARSAIDIPAKVRRNPARTVGLASGAAFLLLGGPRRVARAAEKRFFPARATRPPKVVPRDIERTLERLPEQDQELISAHLERDFAAYLRREHAKDPAGPRQSAWKTYDLLLATVGARAARELTKRLFEPQPEPGDEAHRK